MLHASDKLVRSLLLKGSFGLERESLRVDENGFMSHTPNPFPNEKHIVRDFCENQVEINTPVVNSPKEAVAELEKYDRKIQQTLRALPQREYLWVFSNPPYIRNEDDIPVAQFEGEEAAKTEYRNYLSDRYGRYKMTFSGIHFNYSFGEELLRADFALSGERDFTHYKNQFYVALAEKATAYGWLITAITAASPLMDTSYVEKGRMGGDVFNGMATTRCSELGYWNAFTPIFNYSSIENYADSIQHYVDKGLIRYPSELYYPIRIKPIGSYSLEALKTKGVSHIELRMFDLNPLAPSGIDERDVFFTQLFLVWLAGTPRQSFDEKAQVQAEQNFKNAARYDLKTVKVVAHDGESYPVADAALQVIAQMKEFYADFPQDVQEVLSFQEEKFINPEKRYAWIIRNEFKGEFVRKGLLLAKERQASRCKDFSSAAPKKEGKVPLVMSGREGHVPLTQAIMYQKL
jgi:glutamate--cysteine ligase